jgi:hypothetical protein
MIKKKVLFFGLLLVFAAIIIFRIALVSKSDETPLPVIAEVQNAAEPIILEAPNTTLTETSPLVTTTTPPPATTTEPPVTTAPLVTTTPIITTTAPPVVIITAVASTIPPATTTASPSMPDGTQWVEDGRYFKMEGEQKYRWHEILGWIEAGREGVVTVMDVQSDGYKLYVEPDGRVNLGKVVTPDGDIISYEEYRQWKNSY